MGGGRSDEQEVVASSAAINDIVVASVFTMKYLLYVCRSVCLAVQVFTGAMLCAHVWSSNRCDPLASLPWPWQLCRAPSRWFARRFARRGRGQACGDHTVPVVSAASLAGKRGLPRATGCRAFIRIANEDEGHCHGWTWTANASDLVLLTVSHGARSTEHRAQSTEHAQSDVQSTNTNSHMIRLDRQLY